jgi:hypothetical protein
MISKMDIFSPDWTNEQCTAILRDKVSELNDLLGFMASRGLIVDLDMGDEEDGAPILWLDSVSSKTYLFRSDEFDAPG